MRDVPDRIREQRGMLADEGRTLQLDMPVQVAFTPMDDTITLPLFRPAGAPA